MPSDFECDSKACNDATVRDHHRRGTGSMIMADFTREEIDVIYRVMTARRDMRHFLSDPLDEALVGRLLAAAHLAPSVGLMQPWRFIRVCDRALRAAIHALVEAERLETARALGERDDEFMRLKVEGILECGELLVAALAPGRQKHVFGRRTMPEMDLASVACAIQNMWLAARAEGIGMGWVSLFDPDSLRQLLRMPEGSRPVAVLCLGRVREFYPRPMLEMAHWARRFDVEALVHEDYWSERADVEDPG
jgi:5,6-dimethylbenzimidazole synthase